MVVFNIAEMVLFKVLCSFRNASMRTLHAHYTVFVHFCRAANNFPAGAGQIVRSNLFLLGHIPFLAGQTSITSYRYKSTPSPLHMMFKYETSKFSKHLLHMSIDLNAGKVERMVQQNQYHICAYYCCLSSTSYIRLVMKLMKLTEACNLVDFKCCQKQGSSFPKMRD